MDNLILPTHVEKAQEQKSKALAVGLQRPWENISATRGLRNVATKKGSWRDYYDMYRSHAIVRTAIDTIAKTASNVGLDFVPRDSRAEVSEKEVTKLKAFFRTQDNFGEELYRVYQDMLLYGDAYFYIIPDRRGRPLRFKRLAPSTIFIEADAAGEPLAYYQKLSDDLTDNSVQFEPQEILHFQFPDPDNDLYGLSPLESLKWAIATDIYAIRYNAAFFQNSGVTGTIIGVRNANPDEMERNRKWFETNYTGPENAHTPVVIEGENITISKAVATHTEMGFLKGREFVIMEILAVLGVPPAKLGMMESANRSNSKEQDKTFRSETIAPLQRRVETVINDKFVRGILGVQNTVITHSEGDARDQIDQMDYYTKGINNAVYTPNEVRAVFGKGPVDGGDILAIMTPTGFVPIDRMDLLFQLPSYNSDKIPPSERDPVAGEPVPKAPKQVETAISPAISKSRYGLQNALLTLVNPNAAENDILKSYADLNDAALDIDIDDHIILHTRDSVAKALREKDDLLKSAYLEQARSLVQQMMKALYQAETQEAV